MNIKSLLINQQQQILLIIGYILIAGLAFSLGRISASSNPPPEIRVEEAFAPLNNTSEQPAEQPQNPSNPLTQISPTPATGTDCSTGQIKGNIGSGNNRVYHLPGGSFYNRTVAEMCFNTEAEAVTAGFRKSSR